MSTTIQLCKLCSIEMWHKILFCYAIILHGIDAAESNLSTSIGYISNRKPSPLKSSELFSFENFLEFFASHQSNLYNLKSVDVQCIDDLMQIYDELQNESVESLRSEWWCHAITQILHFIFIPFPFKSICSDRCMGQISIGNINRQFLCIRKFSRMFRCEHCETRQR